MKVNINQFDLIYAIEKAEKVIRPSKHVPVLESVKLSSDNNKITLMANNLESAIVIEVDGSIEEAGSLLIDKSNFKLIKKLSGRLYISDDAGTVKISGNRDLKFKQDLSHFPEINTEVNNEAFTITENEFKDSLKIKIFASSEDYKPVLKTCCIQGDMIAAIDGYRVAKIDLNIDNKCNKDIMIPLNSIMEIDKILDKKSIRDLKFEYFSKTAGNKEELKHLKISGLDWQYYTRLIQGDYMNVKNILPQDFKLNIDIDKNTLNESVEFSKEILSGKQPLIFDLNNEFKVSGVGTEKEFSEVIHNNINIPESKYLKVGYNPKYLSDIFKTLSDDKIKLKFADNSNTILIVTGNKTENETYMLLPIKLAS